MPAHFDERGAALLILVGQREVEETGLMSPSTESEFKLSLKYIILRAGMWFIAFSVFRISFER